MSSFTYVARDPAGTPVRGTVDADSAQSAAAALHGRNLVVTSLVSDEKTALQKDIRIPGITDRISLSDIAVSTRQLATMLDAGLPLIRALAALAEQSANRRLGEVFDAVRADVGIGLSLGQAMEKHPKTFSRLYVAMVRAGETGGALDLVLMRVAGALEAQVRLRSKIRSAAAYPSMVAGMVLLVLTGIMLFVVPQFQTLYADLGGTLPVPTRVLIAVSAVFRSAFPFVLLLTVGGYFGIRRAFRNPKLRLKWDRSKLRLPVFGKLAELTAMSRFSRTTSTLLHTGVGVLESLEITKETVNNAWISGAVDRVSNAVRNGESIAGSMSVEEAFPSMVTHMVSVGEETGAVDELLGKVADYYDDRIDATVAALTSLIEPLLVAVLGGVVGGILISLYLPMFKIVELIQ